jgi:GT2 family glycosyltransferase
MSNPPQAFRPSALRRLARLLRARTLQWWLGRQSPPSRLDEGETRASRSLSIIIPVKDAARLTAKCLASLERWAGEAEVILVDDASREAETRELLRDYVSRNGWTLVTQATSTGHSRATAAGIARSSRPILCLLNSDTIISPYSWEAIVAAFASDPAVAIVGPSTSDTYGPQALQVARQGKLLWDLSHVAAFARRQKERPPQPPQEDLQFIGGFAFFIRRATWEELDGFDPNLPDYGNELDLCLRAVAANLRCVWVKRSYIHHFGGSSYGGQLGGPDGIEARSLAATRYVREKATKLGLQLSHSR